MQTIFVAIKCQLGKAYDVADRLVQEIDEVSGQYDLLAKAYLDDDADLGHFVNERVQTIDGVADTFTTIAFKAFT